MSSGRESDLWRVVTRWGAVGLTAATVSASAGQGAAAHAPAVKVSGAGGPVATVTRVGAAPSAQSIELVLPLYANLPGLERFAAAVSTPGSPRYGMYESIPELARRFGAPPVARRRVLGYLRSEGAEDASVDATGLFAQATMSVARAERVFATPLAEYHSSRTGRFMAPAEQARIPAALRGAVTGVVGLDTRSLADGERPLTGMYGAQVRVRAAQQPSSGYLPASGTQAGCASGVQSGGFTPNQYLAAYGFDPLRLAAVGGQGERVALIEIDGFTDRDVTTFASCFGFGVPRINAFGVGLKKPLPPGGESTLDLEVLAAAAPNLKAIDVYETRPDAADTLKALTAPLHNPGHKPQVVSASLGLCEPFASISLGSPGIRTAEGALELAAASGITFLASSGDTGSAACTDAAGVPFDRLAVNFPASSPWATSVGGTNLELDPTNGIERQVVWNDTFDPPGSAGGGGASELFARPAYQSGTVRARHREQPDVSLLADVAPGYAVYCSAPECVAGGVSPWQSVGGTSAGTPLLAGGLALVDQWLRAHGRQELGLVNPLLYKLGRSRFLRAVAFYDVTQFSNDVGPYIPGFDKALGCCTAGPGYDEASGWGSLNVSAFADLASVFEPQIADVRLTLPGRQRPVKAHQIVATVWCSRGCSLVAFAELTIGRGRPFRVSSATYHLKSRGRHTVAIRFSAQRLRALRKALADRARVSATVFAASLDEGGEIVEQSGGEQLSVRG